jgi:arylsulfatase A-like enzyme
VKVDPFRASVLAAAFAALASSVAGCSRSVPPPPRDRAASLSPTLSSSASAPGEPAPRTSLSAVASTDECTFGHRGVLLDLGDAATRARLTPTERGGRIDAVERDGATWARVFARGASISFVATADDVAASTADGAFPAIEARVRGGAAKSIAVFLNGKAAGVWPLAKGEAHLVSAKIATDANGPQLVTGTNELLLRLRGAAKAGASAPDEEAELDWVHVGGTKADEAYSAPTRADAITSATLAGTPMRVVSLRAPGYARCTGWLPSNARLIGAVGVAGAGDADLELRVVRDRAPPVVLSALHVTGDAPWKSIDLPLAPPPPSARTGAASPNAPPSGAKGATLGAGTLGAIELVAVRSTRGARVLFGDPRVVTAPPAPVSEPLAPFPPRVNGAVIVVEGNVAPRLVDLYTEGGTALPELGALAKSGVVFEANRASGGGSSSALASILTALPARAHGVLDDESGLGRDVTTLADVARQAGIRAAMFTAVPTTGSAFGFGRGWDTFVEHAPDLGEAPGAAVAPFDDAARWLSDRATPGERFLVVIHARGAHPPWDATPEEMRTLPPQDYTGGIDPKRAAELLARVRPQTGPGPRASILRLNDGDRTRAWALYALALKEHDAALGRLLAALKAAGRDGDTLLIVTGDVGLGEARAPFEDPDPLSETALATSLVVRFPSTAGGATAPGSPSAAASLVGSRIAAPTTSADIARTVVDAFGLSPPAAFDGEDLARVALAGATLDARGRPLLAIYGARFSLRWGSFVLRGIQGESLGNESPPADVTKLCDVSLEPECTSDVRGAFPLALTALRRELAAEAQGSHPPVPVVETPTLQASLKLWGL